MVKKYLVFLFLLCAALMIPASAAEDDVETGIRIKAQEEYITLTPQTAAGDSIDPAGDSYPGAARLLVNVTGAAPNSEVLILTQSDEETPTETNIVYIDQRTSADGTANFIIFPKELKVMTYYVYLASDKNGDSVGELQKAAEFEYYLKELNPVLVGDADDNGTVDALDALAILRHVALQVDLSDKMEVADVTNNGEIDALDALDVLRYVAQMITEFERGRRY